MRWTDGEPLESPDSVAASRGKSWYEAAEAELDREQVRRENIAVAMRLLYDAKALVWSDAEKGYVVRP